MIRTCAALACLLACNSHRDRASPASGSAQVAADPWSGSAPPAAPQTPEARERRAKLALERVNGIMPKLARVRGLAFDRDVAREYQSAAAFRTFVRAEIAKELPPAIAADHSAALYHVGLLAKPGNLAELEELAFTSQAGAYYDPATKRFFLVMVPPSDLVLDTISAHELTHALQDQHFDLRTFLPEGDSIDADQAAARRFVAEGDATFTMLLYAFQDMRGLGSSDMVKLLRKQLDQLAAMTPEEMLEQNVAAMSAGVEPELGKSRGAIHDIPPTVLVPMFDSYTKGAQLVATVYERGGWPAVDALYREPPESTEQALHPDTKLYPTRDRPRRVAITSGEGAKVLQLVLGELQWQIYFSLWVPSEKTIASEGWAGDRVIVHKRGDGRFVAQIAAVCDTAKDASELRGAYITSLAKRFPKGTGDPASPAGFLRGDGAGAIFVAQDGAKVFVVDGADDRAPLAALVKSTRFD